MNRLNSWMGTARRVVRQPLSETMLRGAYLAVPWLARIQSLDPKDIRVTGDPPLCSACVRIFSKSRQLQKESILSVSFARLKASAELGCYVCNILYNATWTPQSSRRIEALPLQRLRDISSEPNALAYWIDIADQDEQPGCLEINFTTVCHDKTEDIWYMRLVLVPETAVDENVPMRISDSNDIDIATNLATQWAERCEENHTQCHVTPEPSNWRPTRLIDIGCHGSTQGPRLCLSDDIPSNVCYMTLSHCWGQLDIFKLTQANLATLTVCLPLGRLTNVFQDAIELTRRLNVEYIWIDSLCIIQDSYDDWAHESAMMGEIYKNSWCNISATGFVDGSSSLYVQRIPEILEPRRVNLSVQDPENKISHDVRNEKYYCMEDFWQSDITDAPVNTRAWVFQERLLAPRVLHFGSRQIMWECKELEACEIFPGGIPAVLSSGFKSAGLLQGPSSIHRSYLQERQLKTEDKQELKGQLDSEANVTLSGEDNAEEHPETEPETLGNLTREEVDNSEKIYFVLLEKWRQITGAYNSKRLTRPEDKLVAISGLAGMMAKLTNEEYIAGFWKRNFLQQLAWTAIYEGKDMGRVPRPQSFQGPSWSWACLNARIDDLALMSADPLSAILDYSVTLADRNSFGQVTDGYIRIRGRLSTAKFVASDAELERHWEDRNQSLRLGTSSPEIEVIVNPSIIPDVHQIMPYGKEALPIFPLHHALGATEFWLLPLCLNPGGCVGLLLKHTGTKGQYRRIGAFAQHESSEEEFQALLSHIPVLNNHEYEESDGDGNVVITII